ncbi:MAG: LssY C-terminal domain-containing protein [Bryobacteraceae bacterium]
MRGACAETLPAGTTLHARLATATSSLSKPGEAVEAVMIAPVIIGDAIWVPMGAQVSGKVQSAQPSKPDARAELDLVFDRLVLPDGSQHKVTLRLHEVDNAREVVSEDGVIHGILESETLAAQMDQAIERLGNRFSRLARILEAMRGAVIQKVDTEIRLEAGTEVFLTLLEPLEIPKSYPITDVVPIEPEEELAALVNSLPMRTTAEKPPNPSDLTNLMYLGTCEQIEKAFHAAGWSTAAELNAVSGLETVRAVVEQRGYKEAPMSVLLLEGKPPDLVFQKQYNTFAKRHHLRIFQRPEKFQGREVWVCAATHDIGIDFSPENRTFIHRIDPKIDRERAKVVFDLMHAGAVAGVALVARPAAPTSAENATGDRIETDGRMAVLLLR